MHSFKDKTGDSWQVEIHIGTREKLLAFLSIDLYNPEHLGPFLTALDDPGKLVETLAIICGGELASRGLTIDEFKKRFDGDTIENSTKAIIEEFQLFIRPGLRPGVKKVLEKTERLRQIVSERMEAMAEEADLEGAAQKMIDRQQSELKKQIEQFGNGPEFSEQTPALTPSGN